MTLAPGSRLGPYEILSPIGEGGMGQVFRARDSRLGRDVAVKVLPEAMAKDAESLGRFTREARAVAALNHPHIVTIFSNEEADGVRFMTMELIEGRTLRQIIPERGLQLTQFFDIAIPLADALNAAHQKNITHRDLKPANIMVSDEGRVKILDFGLARATGPDSDSVPTEQDEKYYEITKAGIILGTAPYMSPEQIECRALDHRTDIFSLGVILYEMATGGRPFRGKSVPALMASIMTEHPRPIAEVRPGLPADLAQLVSTCLEKERQNRVKTARDILIELKAMRRAHEIASEPAIHRFTPASPASDVLSIGLRVAVLPFVARGAGHAEEALADGLTEDITAGFARFPHMHVVSRPDAMKLQGQVSGASDVSAVLGARYLVEGHVRAAGQLLRIGVHLADAVTGAHLWAETYDRVLRDGDLFAIQDDISRRVVATIGDQSGVLARFMGLALKDRPIEELTVGGLVLRCFSLQAHSNADEHASLRAGLERALVRDPLQASGWACLAGLYHQEHSAGFNPLPNTAQRHRRAAERAVELDPACQNGWREMAVAHHFFDRDLAGLQVAAERVVSLNPLNTSPVAMVGMLLAYAGNWERGLEIVRQAMQPNPHHPGWYHFPVSMYHYLRQEYDEALLAAKRINMPAFAPSYLGIAISAGQLQRRDDSRAAMQNLERVEPKFVGVERTRNYFGLWVWEEHHLRHLLDGFQKAKALVGDEAMVAPPDPSPLTAPLAKQQEVLDQAAEASAATFSGAALGLPSSALAQSPAVPPRDMAAHEVALAAPGQLAFRLLEEGSAAPERPGDGQLAQEPAAGPVDIATRELFPAIPGPRTLRLPEEGRAAPERPAPERPANEQVPPGNMDRRWLWVGTFVGAGVLAASVAVQLNSTSRETPAQSATDSVANTVPREPVDAVAGSPSPVASPAGNANQKAPLTEAKPAVPAGAQVSRGVAAAVRAAAPGPERPPTQVLGPSPSPVSTPVSSPVLEQPVGLLPGATPSPEESLPQEAKTPVQSGEAARPVEAEENNRPADAALWKTKEPKKIKTVAPEYPAIALQAKVEGTVEVECTIDRQGKVVQATVLRGIPLLNRAATNAIRQWVYEPTLMGGVAVPVVITVTIKFELPKVR